MLIDAAKLSGRSSHGRNQSRANFRPTVAVGLNSRSGPRAWVGVQVDPRQYRVAVYCSYPALVD